MYDTFIMKKCGIILIDKDRQHILLVLGKKSQKWGFPKGHMECGETEEQTAKRELKEETGIEWNGDYINRMRFRNNVYFVVHMREQDAHVKIHDVDEIQQVVWLSYADIVKLSESECNFGLKNWIKKQEIRKNEQNKFLPFHIKC